MVDSPKPVLRGSNQERFGDTPVAFGIMRYTTGRDEDGPMWMFRVSRYIGRDILIQAELKPADLRKMARFLESAAELVQTDGGRISSEVAS